MCRCFSVAKLCPTLQSHGLEPARVLCLWDFPGKNTAMGCHFLLWGSSSGIEPASPGYLVLASGFFTAMPPEKFSCLISCLLCLTIGPQLLHSRDLLLFTYKSILPLFPPESQFSSVQSLSRVRLFATPRTAARQTSLSITNSRSLLKLMIESVMPSSHLILCHPFSSCPQSLPASESFPMSQLFA